MKVSIIVPVYNSEKYLRDCLESLVNQTLEEIEIIAVDDASIDSSPKILAEYAKKYPEKLKVYTNPENKGQGYRGLVTSRLKFLVKTLVMNGVSQ